MIIRGLEAMKYILSHTALFTNKAKWAFVTTLYYNVLFFYLTIPTLDRPIIAEFTKGFSMMTSLINILCL